MVSPLSEDEYRKGVATLKNSKAAGRDDVLVEELTNLGPNAHKWLCAMLINCFIDNKIPTTWRQSKIITILKPGKDSAIPKSYGPISLLCHTYKLYERLILNRIAPTIEQHLIKEQVGFRAGKSCTSQLLNLTQHIEDGYQECKITGTAQARVQEFVRGGAQNLKAFFFFFFFFFCFSIFQGGRSSETS